MLTLLTGAAAGLFHVLSGPDHLAAVAPLAADERKRGWLAGCTWGIGHASGVVVVAVIAVFLREMLPSIDAISAWGERVVGAALIGIGLWALRRSARIEQSPHHHGRVSHNHLHVQAGPAWMRRLGHAHASFCMGVLHGVAGSSHFFGVLPALALPSRSAALMYIGAFGLGTVAAMTVFAAAVGVLGMHTGANPRLHRAMMTVAAALAMLVGGVWLIAPLTV
jgi:threonine/homoserine/homoserine lactone efflux protein